MCAKINAAILGCTGYTGLELVYLLNNHSNVDINYLGSNNYSGDQINKFDERLNTVNLPKISHLDKIAFSDFDVVFFALPHNVSQNIIKDNFGKSIFIDLSADFRLNDPDEYQNNYDHKHLAPNLLNKFAYGLPEIYKDKIKNKKNTAIPGCYPTSVLLPLIPLLNTNLIKSENILIDSKSGYSGAGKKFNLDNLFNKNILNFYNYNTNSHRHICEIQQELNKFSKMEVKFSFNPHILPIFRGMMSTIYCDLHNNINKRDLYELLNKEYSNNPFVQILDGNKIADFFSVYNTNNCLIKLYDNYSEDKVIIVSLIDNLLKGASGQAVQCMNIIFNLEEDRGLI